MYTETGKNIFVSKWLCVSLYKSIQIGWNMEADEKNKSIFLKCKNLQMTVKCWSSQEYKYFRFKVQDTALCRKETILDPVIVHPVYYSQKPLSISMSWSIQIWKFNNCECILSRR